MPEAIRLRHPVWIYLFAAADAAGFLLFLVGVHPALFGLDRSYVIGYLQVFLFLVGLGIVVVCTYAVEILRRSADQAITLREDIGIRLAATGYVVAAFSSSADLIGLGSHPLPRPPHFGLLQSIGLLIGSIMILVGLVMHYPFRLPNSVKQIPDKD